MYESAIRTQAFLIALTYAFTDSYTGAFGSRLGYSMALSLHFVGVVSSAYIVIGKYAKEIHGIYFSDIVTASVILTAYVLPTFYVFKTFNREMVVEVVNANLKKIYANKMIYFPLFLAFYIANLGALFMWPVVTLALISG